MTSRKILCLLKRDERGATAIEFAIVAGVFFMLVLGMIEYGLIMYTQTVVESITMMSAREVSIGKPSGVGCADRVACIKKLVQDKAEVAHLMGRQSVRVSSRVVTDVDKDAPPPVPDICLDIGADHYAATCTQFEDNNGINGYQPEGSLDSAALGKGGDLVEIRVTYLWRVLFPMFKSKFGDNGVLTITSTTVVRNEPFDP